MVFIEAIAGSGCIAAPCMYMLAKRRRTSLRQVKPGEVVVVTGASSGIGRHAALELNKRGFTVFAGVRKLPDGEALKEYAEHPDKLRPLLLDVVNADQLARGFKIVEEECSKNGLHGGLTALFNNAGVADDGVPLAERESTFLEGTPISTFRFIYEVNVFGLVQCTQTFLPLLKVAGGTIINTSSVDGLAAFPFHAAYSSSKFAIEGFSDSLRRELLVDPVGRRVRVVVMQPGCINTKIHNKTISASTRNRGGAAAEMFSQLDANVKLSSIERRFHAQHIDGITTGASPSQTSNVVVEAILSSAPRTRYVVNPYPFLKLMTMVPDWCADKMMMDAVRSHPEEPRVSMEMLEKVLEQAE